MPIGRSMKRRIAPKATEPEAPSPDAREPGPALGDSGGEACVARRLRDIKKLPNTVCETLLAALAAGAPADLKTPFTTLHLLEERAPENLAELLVALAEDSALPLLPLERFEPQRDAYSLLDIEFLTQRGAIPFDTLAETVLVAVLNPYDQKLQRDVREAVARPCRFYLVRASDYDITLSRILNTRPDNPKGTADDGSA